MKLLLTGLILLPASITNQTIELEKSHQEAITIRSNIEIPQKPTAPQKSAVKRKRVITPQRHKELKTAAKQVQNKLTAHTKLLKAAGVPQSVWGCAESLIRRESGWRVDATNPSSGAYGLGQALPANKMASAGADYLTNGVTQLKWVNGYVHTRYGGWCQANNFQLKMGWY